MRLKQYLQMPLPLKKQHRKSTHTPATQLKISSEKAPSGRARRPNCGCVCVVGEKEGEEKDMRMDECILFDTHSHFFTKFTW